MENKYKSMRGNPYYTLSGKEFDRENSDAKYKKSSPLKNFGYGLFFTAALGIAGAHALDKSPVSVKKNNLENTVVSDSTNSQPIEFKDSE